MSRPTTTCSLVAIGPLFSSSWLVLAAYHQAHVNHKKCHSGAVSGWKQCWWKNEACLSWYPCLYYLGGEEQKNFLQHMQLYCFSLSQIPDSIFHGFPFPRQWSFFSPCWLLTSLLSYLIRLGCSGCAFLVVRWWFVRWVLLCLCKLLFMVSLARAICFCVLHGIAWACMPFHILLFWSILGISVRPCMLRAGRAWFLISAWVSCCPLFLVVSALICFGCNLDGPPLCMVPSTSLC